MNVYKKAEPEIADMALQIMQQFETHHPLLDAKIRIDYVMAYGERDERTGEVISWALTKNGCKALGITRKVSPKDRAKGLGDAEICLDGDWWEEHDRNEQEALLDHELHHICVTAKRDDMGRPVLKLRKHDVEFGWFNIVAARHGAVSMERDQARRLMENCGQYYWPEIAAAKPSRIAKLELAEAAK